MRPTCVAYALEKTNHRDAEDWVERLLRRSYGRAKPFRRIMVLINPFGGSGRAQKYFQKDIEPIFAASGCQLEVMKTQYAGHAAEIAQKMDINAFDVVASCSGDGLPHEVFNGLGRRGDATRALKSLAVVQLPCGSGNAMSLNLNGTDSPSIAALAVVKGLRTPMDLVSVTQEQTRTLSFLSQALGIVAEADLGTEHLRWMGDARFTYGILVRLLGKVAYPCDIAVKTALDDKLAIKARYREAVKKVAVTHGDVSENRRDPVTESDDSFHAGLPTLRYGTVLDDLPEGWVVQPHDLLGNFYAGNMALMAADTTFFPAALPSDGCLDLVCVSSGISRWEALKSIIAVGNGTFVEMPHVNYRKVEAFRVVPRPRHDQERSSSSGNVKENMIAIDGERFPYKPFQVEVHQGLGTVLSKSGNLYESQLLR